MKVAYFTNQYPKVSHTFIRREIAGVEAAGLQVERISIRRTREALVDERDLAEARRTRVLLDRGAWALLPDALLTALARPVRMLRALRLALAMGWRSPRGLGRHLAYLAEACVLRRWTARSGVDHVHVHFSTNPADVALLCRELGGPPFSFTAHRIDVGAPSSASIALKIEKAEFAIAICEDGRRRMLAHSPCGLEEKVRVIRCGVDEQFLRAAPSAVTTAPRLVCVARLSPEKGIAVLLRAAQRLAAEGLAFELSIVGDGPDRAALERSARSLGLDGRVRFEGWQSGEAVRARLLDARALVLPSYYEGLPVVIMEAFALGRPVIATSVGGVPELVAPEVTGWLVAAGSDDELAGAMRDALTRESSDLDAMGRRGARRVAAAHDAGTQARAVARLLMESIAQRRGGTAAGDARPDLADGRA